MFKNLLIALGLRRAPQPFMRRRGGMMFGGLLPTIAWMAWRNRDQIKSAYGRYVAPRLHRSGNADARSQGMAAGI